MTYVVQEIIKKNTDTANNYGKLTALYQVLNYIQREINKLEDKLPPEDK
mgnify:FL=1